MNITINLDIRLLLKIQKWPTNKYANKSKAWKTIEKSQIITRQTLTKKKNDFKNIISEF